MDGTEVLDRQAGAQGAARYSAFISYSHADAAFAKRLHRKLETYRLPHRALQRASAGATSANGRLKPLFRDQDELPATSDLTGAVRQAIAGSEHLIVVCSPEAAASKWVAREIDLFRELHGGAGVIAALARGEAADAFPAALRRGAEPLAADFRGDRAGRKLALLKLLATLAGVGLDELVQRDAQRQVRSMGLMAVGAVAGLAVVSGLGFAAFEARRDAAVESRRAGSLGEFMTTDLRKGLEAAGRHDLLAQVDQATLRSLEMDTSRLTADQLIQRAAALQGAGQDAEKKGDLKAARAEFEAALKSTTVLLADKADDPKRIFADAQSEYWVGFIDKREGDSEAARRHYEAYARLADRLVAADPNNGAWRKEKAYAAGDLGGLALRRTGDARSAERYFRSALTELDAVARHNPADPDVRKERAKGLGWLADAQRLEGHLDEASATRAEQRQVYLSLLDANPRDVGVKAQLLFNELAIARIALARGDTDRALALVEAGRKHALELQAQDPDNKDFPKQERMFELFRARIWLDLPPGRRPQARTIAGVLGDCRAQGPGSDNLEISDFCDVLLARLRYAEGDRAGALAALSAVRRDAAASHDLLTARWGLNLADEARPVQLADIRGGAR